MIKINKENLLSIAVGIIVGAFFLVINVLFSSFERAPFSATNVEEKVFILADNSVKSDDLLIPLLIMFGFNVDALKNEGKDDLLSILEDISVRIVAQSTVGGILHTLLEVVTKKETKRLVITEGTIVNGFLIKSINSKLLILEKDNEEYSIKLFHPKELNQNRIKNELK